jgi:hypothetical protein
MPHVKVRQPDRLPNVHRRNEGRMADDLKNRDTQDRRRVNVHEDYEVAYWAKKWA